MSECFVSDDDFARYFKKADAITVEWHWEGVERRICADRRSGAHERRWDKSRGRRFNIERRRTLTAPLKSVRRTL